MASLSLSKLPRLCQPASFVRFAAQSANRIYVVPTVSIETILSIWGDDHLAVWFLDNYWYATQNKYREYDCA